MQQTRLGAGSATVLARMVGTVRSRQLVADEVDALAALTAGQLTTLWRVRRKQTLATDRSAYSPLPTQK